MKGYRLQPACRQGRVLGYSILLFVLLSTVHCTLYPVYAADIGQSSITPASPLYFLKSVREVLELKFAGTKHVQALRRLEFATRRIREVKSLAQTSREDLIQPALENYWFQLQKLSGIIDRINLKDENTIEQISSTTTMQMEVLQKISDLVVEASAKRAVRTAVYRLSQWEQSLADKLYLAKQFDVVQKVVGSKLSGCNFLSKEASASALNEVERMVLSERAEKCLDQKP